LDREEKQLLFFIDKRVGQLVSLNTEKIIELKSKDDNSKMKELKEIYSKDNSIVYFKERPNPNPKCKKCYGRGYIGKNIITGKLQLCPKCIYKKLNL